MHVYYVLVCAAALTVLAQAAAQDQPPRFRSGVEITSMDATVVDGDGRPVLNLRPVDFIVEIDGVPRRVVTADWVPLTTAARSPGRPRLPNGYTSNETTTGGRMILLVIDQPNIRFGGTVGHQAAIRSFIDRLEPSDQVVVVGIGPGAKSLSFTTDRAQAKEALSRMVGQRGIPPLESTPEALLRLLDALKAIDGPKALVLISEGFGISLEQRPVLLDLERRAALARSTVYALRLDERVTNTNQGDLDPLLGPTLEDAAGSGRSGRGRSQPLPNQPFPPGPAGARDPDRATAGEGLSAAAVATGGAMFTVVMSADSALARIELELSGYYLLGVESSLADKDGKPHRIDVSVGRRGVVVRSRRQLR